MEDGLGVDPHRLETGQQFSRLSTLPSVGTIHYRVYRPSMFRYHGETELGSNGPSEWGRTTAVRLMRSLHCHYATLENGPPSGTRTHNLRILSPSPLPIGLREENFSRHGIAVWGVKMGDNPRASA